MFRVLRIIRVNEVYLNLPKPTFEQGPYKVDIGACYKNVGGCQNYGPFLGPSYDSGPIT